MKQLLHSAVHSLRSRVAVAAVGLGVVVLGFAACGGGSSLSVAGLPGAASVGPRSVTGYGACAEPACVDLARACDDVIRSGCGTVFLASGSMPDPATQAFKDAVGG
jgi:hypothetical protein